MAINYFSPVRLTLALLPELVERAGRIVFISSVAARLSPPGEAAYAASKAAISAWAECMKVDLRDTDGEDPRRQPGRHRHRAVPRSPTTIRCADGDRGVARRRAGRARCWTSSSRTRFEVYVPDWFPDVYAGKYRDVEAFLEGTIAYVRTQEAEGTG